MAGGKGAKTPLVSFGYRPPHASFFRQFGYLILRTDEGRGVIGSGLGLGLGAGLDALNGAADSPEARRAGRGLNPGLFACSRAVFFSAIIVLCLENLYIRQRRGKASMASLVRINRRDSPLHQDGLTIFSGCGA
jgi:hypothetical protein